MKNYKDEAEYQADLKKKLKQLYPSGIVIKNDATDLQGVADLTIIDGPKAAILEVKISKDAKHRPNQDYYVNRQNERGGFGRFIYPENESEVLKELKEFMDK